MWGAWGFYGKQTYSLSYTALFRSLMTEIFSLTWMENTLGFPLPTYLPA